MNHIGFGLSGHLSKQILMIVLSLEEKWFFLLQSYLALYVHMNAFCLPGTSCFPTILLDVFNPIILESSWLLIEWKFLKIEALFFLFLQYSKYFHVCGCACNTEREKFHKILMSCIQLSQHSGFWFSGCSIIPLSIPMFEILEMVPGIYLTCAIQCFPQFWYLQSKYIIF